MSIALDPNERAEVWLPRYDTADPKIRPVFLAHYLTCREALKYEQAVEDAFKFEGSQAEQDAKLNAVLMLALVGWRNVVDRDGKPIEFSADALSDVLTPAEKWAMMYRLPNRLAVSESDAKKSSLPPTSDGASTVKDA